MRRNSLQSFWVLAVILILASSSIIGIILITNASNSCDPTVYVCSQDPQGYYPDNATAYSIVSPTNGLLTAPQAFIQNGVNYILNLYNPTVGLVAVGQTSCICTAVTFNYLNGNGGCPQIPSNQRFIPFENWKYAAALAGIGTNQQIANNIFSTVQGFETSLNWRPPQNLESVLGYIIPYAIQNTNVCFTPNGGPPTFINFNGFQGQIDQAIPWDYNCQCFKAPQMDYTKAVGLNDPMNTVAQAINFQLRGPQGHQYAKQDLQAVVDTCHVNNDGSVGFGPSPYRGILLGAVLEAEEVIGTPKLKIGCSISAIIKTLVNLQQPDGGIAINYTCAIGNNCTIGGSIDEASNQGLLAFAPGIIQRIRSIASSGQYNLNSVPNTSPNIGI